MNVERRSLGYTAQRLVERTDLEAILEHNLTHIDTWRGRYPNHEGWIRSAIQSFQDDDYARLAFGVFASGGEYARRLVCSAIVKKYHFAPYLEIKNLILINEPEDFDPGELALHKEQCYKELIQHLKSFAESRGYTRLVVELFNRNESEHDLIQAFLRRGFFLSGSQSRRYRDTDEVLILTFDVNAIYGLDPYDHESATNWIVKRYLPDFELVKERTIELYYDDSTVPLELVCLELVSHQSGSPVLSRFASTCYVVIIEYFLIQARGIRSINRIGRAPDADKSGRYYVFDFTYKSSGAPTVWQTEFFPLLRTREKESGYFDRLEINSLLYKMQAGKGAADKQKTDAGGLLRVAADLSPAKIAGLATLTDPTRLDVTGIQKIVAQGHSFVYIKLGPKGKKVEPGDLLAFYFPASDVSLAGSIWAFANIEKVVHVNIGRVRTATDIKKSDGQVLFDHLDDLQLDSDPPSQALWDPKAFGKHNRYNATNEVVCLYVSSFVDLRERPLMLDEVVRGPVQERVDRRKAMIREIDAYLSFEEVDAIKAHARVSLSKLDRETDGRAHLPSATPRRSNPAASATGPSALLIAAAPVELRAIQRFLTEHVGEGLSQAVDLEASAFAQCFHDKVSGATIYLVAQPLQSSLYAAETTTIYQSKLKPDVVMMVGMCMGMPSHSLKPGTVIVPNEVYLFDHKRSTADGVQIRPHGQVTVSALFSLAQIESDEACGFPVVMKGMATASTKVEDRNDEVIAFIEKSHPDIVAYDMESAGFYSAAKGLHYLVVKAVADAGEAQPDSDEKHLVQSNVTQNAICFALRLIRAFAGSKI